MKLYFIINFPTQLLKEQVAKFTSLLCIGLLVVTNSGSLEEGAGKLCWECVPTDHITVSKCCFTSTETTREAQDVHLDTHSSWALNWLAPSDYISIYCSGGGGQSSGAVWKSRWTSWAPVPNKPTVSVDVNQPSTVWVLLASTGRGAWDEHYTGTWSPPSPPCLLTPHSPVPVNRMWFLLTQSATRLPVGGRFDLTVNR